MYAPLISICVPAYRKPAFVTRLLDSVLRQDYKQVEVIISDDSPDESVNLAIAPYINKLNLRYYHNQPAKGSPVNWNFALDQARGELLMLLHQDDWLYAPDALRSYVEAFGSDSSLDFVFCKNIAVREDGSEIVLQALPGLLHRLDRLPNHLVRADVIGPPSNVMVRSTVTTRYDERFIWLVDVDYYVRLLKQGCRYRYLDRHLVSIGLHADQTTNYCRENESIILKENILFAAKLEAGAFRDWKIYDYFWRLLRNHRVRSQEDLLQSGVSAEQVPPVISHMLALERRIPLRLLHLGPVSKLLMFVSYVQQ
ncbi:MAG TPA: glycosyltransferase [Chitinophagaceae bacterium]|nr:glycosyltransferase [Chitinophagaceae bacterium]